MIEADRAYREYARADSLLPLLPSSPGVTVHLPPALAEAARDSLAAFLGREVAALEHPRGRAAAFLVHIAYGGHPRVRLRGPLGREIYAGVDSLGAYCALVGTGGIGNEGAMVIDAFSQLRQRRRAGILGPCTFVARYGAPGARLSQWLRDGGYALAEVPHPDGPHETRPAGSSMLWTGDDLRMRGCVAGRADLCERILSFAPEEQPPSAGAATMRLLSGFTFRGTEYRMLLSEIETAFGPDRFERFWTSDDDVSVAFAAAFGLEFGDWVREWGEAVYGPQRLGPGPGAVTLLLSALALLSLAAIAAMISVRRRI